MQIDIPEFALVLLVGASGTGKSTFAARHFLPTEVVSSDRARGWIADDETDQGLKNCCVGANCAIASDANIWPHHSACGDHRTAADLGMRTDDGKRINHDTRLQPSRRMHVRAGAAAALAK